LECAAGQRRGVVVLPDDWGGDSGRLALAQLLLPGVWAVWLGGPTNVGPSSRRRDLRAHSVIVLPSVLAQRPVREARNAGTAVSGFENALFVVVANFFQRPVPQAVRVAFAGFRDLNDFLSDNFG
jgi:hypothetical protein